MANVGINILEECLKYTQVNRCRIIPTKRVNITMFENLKYVPNADNFSKPSLQMLRTAISKQYEFSIREFEQITPLLSEDVSKLILKNVPKDTPGNKIFLFADVIKRKGHSTEYVEKLLKINPEIDNKLIYTLEFKDIDKVKNITIEDFEKMSLQDRKDFINAFISMGRSINREWQTNLPDIVIFDSIKKIDTKNLSFKERNDLLENEYYNLLIRLLHKIPRGKSNLPKYQKSVLPPECILDIKPPLTNSVKSIPTTKEFIYGHNVRIGELPTDGSYYVHNMGEKALSKLEAFILTDPNAILCTGVCGGKGMLKGKNRIGIITNPLSIEDLLIQANQDVSSGYGAVKNLFNIQMKFLKQDNPANNYVPSLIREKLGISIDAYNQRISKLIKAKASHIEDIENIDKELYDIVKNIMQEYPMFEAIMRPKPEGIYLPENKKITEQIAEFAELYDIPILRKKNR